MHIFEIAGVYRRLKECITVMLQTYQTKKRQRKKVHGFRARMKTHTGAKVVARRRRKGRKVLTA